jgi:hypothetical protein
MNAALQQALEQQMGGGMQTGGGGGGGGGGGPLDYLRNDPQFNMLRQLVQARPEMLQPLLEQIGQVRSEW